MKDPRAIALEIKLDGLRVASETTCAWVGPYLLMVATTLPEADLAVEVYSTFVAHTDVPARAIHLVLGPVGYLPMTITGEHENGDLEPDEKVRQCVYEHAQILLEALGDLGYQLGIDVPDSAFVELERVE